MRAMYPIERQCSHLTETFQLRFARNALQMLPLSEETSFEPGPNGLRLLGETEMALDRPVQRLAEIYGDSIRIGPPTVRYRQGARTEEPYMGLRVQCIPGHYEAVRQDLRVLNAVLLDAEVNHCFAIVRARASLASLLGYQSRLAQLTGGSAQLVMWLSHYEMIEDPPPDGRAA